MVLSSFLLLVATSLVADGLAKAIPSRYGVTLEEAGSHNFSVTQVRNTRFVGHGHGPLARAKAYRKYGVPVPEELASVVSRLLSKRTTGSAVTTPEGSDVEFLTLVSIGSPPQVLSLDFDTGSSDLWVFSSETPWGSVNGQATYNPFLSNTSTKIPNAKWSISYGDGSASSGDVYTDKVTVGGLTVSKQAVEAAQTVSASFTSDSNNDGLLGLAFSSINTVTPNRQKTFFDNAKAALDAPLFTADLKHGVAGSYNFGFIDQAAYTGDITYTPVDSSQGFWKFSASGYSIGTGNFSSTEISGIADTGTTLLLLPASIVKAYYAKVSGARYDSNQAGYVFSCAATLPDFTFGVGNAKITIPGSYINFAPVDGSDGTDTQCYGGIQEDTGIGFAVYGDIALKAAFVVFDGGNTTRLGWASKAL